MHEPTYRQALSHGWKVIWDHKQLWVLGFFATLLGQVGLMDFAVKFFSVTKEFAALPLLFTVPDAVQTVWHGMAELRLSADQWIWFAWLLLFFLGAAVLAIFVSVVSQGALLSGIAMFIKHPLKGHIHMEKVWKDGRRHFWRLFSLHAIKRIVLWCIVTSVGLGLLNAIDSETGADRFLFSALFFLGALVAVVLSFIILYAAAYVVIEGYGVGESLLAAWRLFLRHWLVSLEIGLILLLVNAVVGLVALAGFAFFLLELAVFWFAGLIIGTPLFWSIALVVASVIFILFVVLVGTLLTLFTTSVWTYLFMKMHKEGVRSRLIRWFHST